MVSVRGRDDSGVDVIRLYKRLKLGIAAAPY